MYDFWRTLWTSIGEFMEWTFGLLPALHNLPNILFIIVGFLAFFYWMGQLVKFQKEEKAS